MSDRQMPALARDEAGGGTLMGLFWFVLLVGILSLAAGATNGERNETMLQATADSAALAAAIDLPDQTAAVDTAVDYAERNMEPELHGYVLDPADVLVGEWDPATPAINTESASPDSVMVTVWRGAANSNALPLHFLRSIGLESWNVRARAVAQRYIPECLRHGLIARNMVDMSSNNHVTNDICIHGQEGVNIQSGNTFDPGVVVSTLDMERLELPASGPDSNSGLEQALMERGLPPRMVNEVDDIMQRVLDRDPAVLPEYIEAGEPVIEVDGKFDLDEAKPHRIYHVQCKSNENAKIPDNAVIQHVAIIADCELRIGADATLQNAVLGSRSGADGKIGKANVSAAAKVQLGQPDNCAPGGGVQIYSNATIHTASSTRIDGVQMVARGDIGLGARDQGINGISAQSGGDITMTSNDIFGPCQAGTPELFTSWYYRLVL